MAETPTPSEVLDAVTALLGRRNLLLQQEQAWATGAADGGPNGDGLFPIGLSDGTQVLIPSPKKLAEGSTAYGDSIVAWVDSIKSAIGDLKAVSDSAYAAENAELAAAESALSARISQALNFPSDFVEGSRYWAGGNGQIATPEAAANNPVPGTFTGGFWQSPANPESCYSVGPIGYVPGIPGTRILITARFRALTDVTNGAGPSNNGVGILPLAQNFSLVQFVSGAGAGPVAVADGWKEITFDFTVPLRTDPTYGAYYRPTFFINVVGSANPLTPSLDKQGNQQFELAWMTTVVTLPGAVVGADAPPTKRQLVTPGAIGFDIPIGAKALRIRLKGGGGGGAGGGSNATDGAAGGVTSFGPFSCSGGSGGSKGDAPNYARGGSGGPSIGAAPNESLPGAPGGNGNNGYATAPGADGGGGRGGKAGGFELAQFPVPVGSGCGGAGGNSNGNPHPGGGGGEGGELETIIANPAAHYDGAVGDGGIGGQKGGEQYATAGQNGGCGYITVEVIF